MSLSPGVANQVLDLMAGLGKVTTKRMFGEMGVYLGPQIFALIIDDELYLKATGALAEQLRDQGAKQFTPGSNGRKKVAMPYWTAPEGCLDDAAEMEVWCRKALDGLTAGATNNKKTTERKKVV